MIRYTLRQLEYFVAVGEAGSIMLAAGKVNVSSPSISAAISQLETEFGMPLFVRQHAQGLSLTQAGRTLMEQAKVVLREADRLVDLAGDISGTVRGPIAVGGMLTFAQTVLPPLRKDFVEAYPEARFTQIELDANELVSALRRAEIDVALGYDLVLPPDLKFVPLLDLPPFVVLPKDHPWPTARRSPWRICAPSPWCCSICRKAPTTSCRSSMRRASSRSSPNGRATSRWCAVWLPTASAIPSPICGP